MSGTYRIVRFYRDGERRVIKRGVTLEEAQEHCNDPATASDTWFDGYELEIPVWPPHGGAT